jgi:hypothetical protein
MNRNAALFCIALFAGCAGAEQTDSSANEETDQPPMGLHLLSEEPSVRADSTSVQMTYYGGPVIAKVKLHVVFWGKKVHYQKELDSFYTTVVDSPYLDWLAEYSTASQSIGRGSFGKSIVDGDAPGDSTITDAQIQAELGRLIDSGKLAKPSANNLYMVHFPPGVTIVQKDGSASCQVFCAYHSTFVHKGVNVYYGVLPDFGGACAHGCGAASQLANTTAASSHELGEAITDAAVGLASSFAAPLAWYDEANGEIGDVCVGQTANVSGFTVQQLWSNTKSSCYAGSDGSCAPSCDGKSCGDDGCGGSCGSCATGEQCSSGQCAPSCTPRCDGKSCGDDGCGGACGTCPAGQSCDSEGQCQTTGGCGESEPNNTPAQANAPCADGTISGTIQPVGDLDWFKLEIKRRQQYTITLSKLAANFNMSLYRASASGRLRLVETARDGGKSGERRIAHRSSSGGSYYLKVFGVDKATSTSPYLVTVTLK